ncbi:LamG-like jellyroll fold domain-containing protein [Dactylosporangium salmoneum]|uniref:Laminin G domain-containing protein n=1 Tax=Dactylosporangium salmoneum TaxID=53361 RepID=A0ABN3FKR5_9ACTN
MNASRWFKRDRDAGTVNRQVSARRRGRRATRSVAVLALLVMALLAAIPEGVAHDGPQAGFPLHLPSWLEPGKPANWGREAFVGLPQQKGGGRPAKLTAEQLNELGRADRGAGRPAGKGIGATPPYETPVHHAVQGTSPAISGPNSFNAATSKLLPAKGSADTEVFQNTDGSITKRMYTDPVNVRQADGTWKHMDGTLMAAGDRLQPKVSAADVSIGRTADDPQLVTLRGIGGGAFAYALQGAAKVPGTVKGDTVTYTAVQPGVDLELRATGSGVKENLIVASASAGNTWTFPLSLDKLTVRAGDADSVELVGADGKVAATIPAGIVHDSKFDQQSGGFEQATEARYSVVTAGGHPALQVTVDQAWLDDPARVYPVVVDPTVSLGNNANVDTTVRNDRTSDQNGDTEMSIGNNGASPAVKAYSFLRFDSFYSTFTNVNVTAASLSVWDSWAWTCTPESFEVNPITSNWWPGSLSYPGPSFGGAIGSLTPTQAQTNAACTNTGGNRALGTMLTVPLSPATFNNWAHNSGNNGLALTTSQTDAKHWKKFTTSNFGSNYTPSLWITYQIETPVVTSMVPPYGYASPTLTPELQVVAYDPDNAPNPSLSYTFEVHDKNNALVWKSASQAAPTIRVPAGLLKWGESYSWIAYAFDGSFNQGVQDWYSFSTPVPQPDITSTLSQNGELGYEPSVRNYTTSATDANVTTVGPALTVERDYNSLDPRTNSAFGTGWSSLFDLSVTEVMSGDATPAVNTVTVRYPTGQEIAFGRNSDGSFAPPQGRYATFTSLGAGAGYKLVDKDGTTYLFTSPLVTGSTTTPYTWGITSITDSSDRTETYHYTGNLIDTVTSASGRALHLTWGVPGGGGTTTYTETSGAATFVDQTDDPAATLLSLTGDDVTTQVTLPFSFPLYGQNYTDARISTNGTIAFDAMAGLSDGVNTDIPNTAAPNSALYPFWDDFLIDAYSKVTTKVSGAAPNRVFSVEWYNAYLFGRSTRVTVKAALAENGTVTFSYNDIDAANNEDRGASAVVGIENAAGTVAAKHSFHQPVLASNTQITYTPVVTPPPGVTARVATVTTDPATAGDPSTALTWSYTYDANGQLQKVCPPTSSTQCQTYTYGAASLYQSAVMNFGPRAYWRLGDAPGATSASSEVIENQGTDAGTYGANVVRTGAGPLPASGANGAYFDGSGASYLTLPTKDLSFGGGYQSASLWFKAATGDVGVLLGFSKDTIFGGSTSGGYNPALYVGTSGYLYGEFWQGSANTPIKSLLPVADGNWHHVVLSGAGGTQTLYVDNVLQGTLAGSINMLQFGTSTNATIGSGYWGGFWPDQPSYSTTDMTGHLKSFKGSIAEVATFERPLTTANVASLYKAGTMTARPLTGVIRPTGNATATITYEPKDSTVKTVTDANGGVWTLAAPTTAGSSKVYEASVLAGSPADYYRFAESGGQSQAVNEVNGNPATYNSVTLGLPSGLFADSQVAQFDGTQSYVLLPDSGPGSDVPTSNQFSATLWFKTQSSSGGVLLGAWQSSLSTNQWYTPHLYVGTDGKLRGTFWTTGSSTIFTSANAVNDGSWHYAAIAGSANSQKLYLDGAEIGSATNTATSDNTDHISVGAGAWKNWPSAGTTNPGYFNGFISDVAYYRNQISAATVAHQYAAWQKSKNSAVPAKVVTVLDPKSNPLTYTFDLNTGRKVADVDALGNETRYGYSDDGFLRTVTDPLGNVTTNEHDVRGNTVSTATCQVQKNNVCSTVYFEYFPDGGAANKNPAPDRRNDMLLTQRDGRSSGPADNTYKTSFTYDSNGNRLTSTDALGRTTATEYTSNTPAFDTGNAPNGLQKTVTMPSGAKQQVVYYHNGDIAQVTDPAGKITKYTYDSLGRTLTQLEVSETFPSGIGSTFTYDGQNRVLTQAGTPVTNRVTGAVHTTLTTTSYDPDGHVLSQVVSDPTGGDASRTQSSTYNAHGQTETETSGGKTTTYGYDPVTGDIVQETDADGGVTLNEYDAEHRLTATKIKDYTGDPNAPSAPTTLTVATKFYDANGRLVLETDTLGFQTIHKYTDNGLEAQVIRKDPTSGAQFVQADKTYDAAGNVVKEVSDNGTSTTTYTLDAASRVVGTTLDPAGINRKTTLTLSPDDQPLSSVVTDGNTSTQLSRSENTYDEMGRSTSQTVYNTLGTVPVARWKLDETSGATAADSVGNAPATGQYVAWSTDHPATSTSAGSGVFNGVSTYMSTNTAVLDTTNGFTVSAWAKAAGGTDYKTVVAQEGTQQGAFSLQYIPDSGGRWSFAMRSTDDGTPTTVRATATTAVALNTWTHLLGVYDADAKTMTLYVNGTATAPVSYRQPWKAKGPLTIGRGISVSYGGYWNGSISDVQSYSRPLSAAEIATVYNGTAPVAGATVNRTVSKLDKGGLQVRSIDPLGNVTDNGYDEAGRLSVVTAPAVQAETGGGAPVATRPVSKIGYDTFGLKTHVQDPNGNITQTSYDSAGRVTTSTAPSYTPPGSTTPIVPVTTRAYDQTGQLIKVTDALNHDTTYAYDQLGRVSKTVAADTGVTRFTYDLNGDQLSVIDPTGAVTTHTYDYLSRKSTTSQVVRQDSNHYDTLFEYGTNGKLSKQTSPTGVTQQFTYNAAGEVVTSKDGANNTTTTTYDAAGRPVKTTLADNSYTSNTYDPGGHPVQTQRFGPSGGTALTTISQAYDRAGNIMSRTDARSHTTTFAYDAAGKLTSETQPVDGVAANNIVTSFGYDVAGNRTRFTDGRGNAFITTYNVWNLPESQIEPSTTAYPNAADRTFTVAYDVLARPVSQSMPGGVTTNNTYNFVGKLTKQAGTGAEVTTADRTFDYDLAGRLTSTTGSGGSNTFTYDDRGLLLTTTGVSGSATFGYKPDGQLGSRADAAGNTAYTYDSAGRLDTIANTTTSVQAKWTYDNLNQPSTVTYGGTSNVRSFGYDSLHRITTDELKTSGGTSIAKVTYGWDNNDNETSKTTTGFGGTVSNSYTYDFADRLISWNNGTTNTAYTYDKSGNRTGNGSKTFSYDQRNQLLTQSGGITYAYTKRGTLSSTTSASAGMLPTKADAFGQVTQQYSTSTASQSYTYDGLGRQVKTGLSYTGMNNDLAADTTATYTRDTMNRVVGVKGASAQYAFTDRHDDVTGLFTATGTALSGTTVYDPLGKVLAATGMQGSLGYQSEWTDQSTSRVNMMARWYNTDTGQFDTRDTTSSNPTPNSAAANRYAYGNDNPLTTEDPTGHWGLSSIWHAATTVVKAVTPPVIYNAVSSFAHEAYNEFRSVASYAWNTLKSVGNTVLNAVVKLATPLVNAGKKFVSHVASAARQRYNATLAVARQAGKAAAAAAQKVAIVRKIADATQAAVKFVQEHKTAIIEGLAIVGGIAAGLACTAATAGAGAVACMVGAAAIINLAKDAAEGNIHSWKDALGSAGTGALQGLMGAAGGALGGVVGGKVASWAAGKLAGMAVNTFGKIAAGAISGALSGAVSGAIGDVVSQLGTTGHVDWGSVGMSALIGGVTGAVSGGRAAKKGGQERESGGGGCTVPRPSASHSFDPGTLVVMADGSAKAIKDVRVGDQVAATDPTSGVTQAEPVTHLFLNHDTELTDLTVRVSVANDRSAAPPSKTLLRQVGVSVAAAATLAAGATTSVLHTTAHHPFWDRTTNTFVEAGELQAGHELRTDEGATVVVTDVHNFTGAKDMHDLTVAAVHTYYVVTAVTPVLVHNYGAECENAPNFDENLYRGVPDNHDHYEAAGEGRAVPLGGHSDPARHAANDTQSEMTSWTHDIDEARSAAAQGHGDGVILRTPHEDVPYGRDILIHGTDNEMYEEWEHQIYGEFKAPHLSRDGGETWESTASEED